MLKKIANALYRRELQLLVALLVGIATASATGNPFLIRNGQLRVSISSDGSYAIESTELNQPVLRAHVGAMFDNEWVKSTGYPRHVTEKSSFSDALGPGQKIRIRFTGLSGRPDLICILQLYDHQPYGEVQVRVANNTSRTVRLEAIRSMDAFGSPRVNLGGHEASDRVMSDNFGLRGPTIDNIDQAPQALHRAEWSQLIYNKDTKNSLLLAALTARHFVTVLKLKVKHTSSKEPEIASYTVDSTGTNEVLSRGIRLSLPLKPGGHLSSEPILFSVGHDYHAQLEAYAKAVGRVNHARVAPVPMMGWWSWTAFYRGINAGAALTNADWLSEHLKSLGYDWFFIDSGYQYARGEYTSPNLAQFPHGMGPVGHAVALRGLKFGIWVAPFEVSPRASVYLHHKDWLVHDAHGKPIVMGYVPATKVPMYVLDTTNPAAQQYLRRTYKTLVEKWGVRYIKMDYWGSTAIEGYRFRPNTTALQAQRIGFSVIRNAVGDHVLLDKDGGPPLPFVGKADMARIAGDTAHRFSVMKRVGLALAGRYYENGNFFRTDPDAFQVSKEVIPPELPGQPSQSPITLSEAKVSIALAALSGGMFELGDNLTTLAAEPERLALVKIHELIQLAELGHTATPLDLMTFPSADQQPSEFFLREDPRQSILGVFNWTDQPHSYTITLRDLSLPDRGAYKAYDIFNNDQLVSFKGNSLRFNSEPPRSVRLIKIVDTSAAAAPPVVDANVPKEGSLMEPVGFSASSSGRVPAIEYRWDFGDGTHAVGPKVTHTFTTARTYTVHLTVDGVDGVAARKSFSITITGTLKIRKPSMLVNLEKNSTGPKNRS